MKTFMSLHLFGPARYNGVFCRRVKLTKSFPKRTILDPFSLVADDDGDSWRERTASDGDL
jgi:hypothetical protein